MKTTTITKFLVVSLAALPLLAAGARAAGIADGVTNNANGSSTGNYQAAYPGDVFLGFSSSSLGKNYVVDLGSIDQVKAFTIGSSLNLSYDLSTVFGASWYATSDLTWGVFGVIDDGGGNPADLIVSSAKGSLPPDPLNASAQTLAESPINTIINQVNFDSQYGRALNYGVYQQNGSNGDFKGANMWLGIADTATPFSVYNQSIVASAYFSGGSGDTNRSNLELYDVSADGVTVTKNSTFLALDAQGNVTAVPEPSTWALMTLAAALLAWSAYRRRDNGITRRTVAWSYRD